MKVSNILYAVLISVALSTVSCDDFLNLTPMNEIVKENYWTEKSDVESVVNSCYAGLSSNDCLKRMFVWGEMRSDNITTSGSTSFNDQQVLKENILQTNNWASWQCFYQVINRCNTVIEFAPLVAEKDPNYTDSELKVTIAEVKALRALCYFYLLRTFRDVPYVTVPSLDDKNIEEQYRVAVTPMKEVIAALIADLEGVKNDALRLYPDEGYPLYEAANSSRVTCSFIYALLADLYLWNSEYEKCVECCDYIIDFKMEQYEEMKEEDDVTYTLIELYRDKYPLLSEQPSGNRLGSAYNSIFGEGNSFESIFELYFYENQSVSNDLVNDYYGRSNGNIGNVSVSSLLASGVYEGTNEVFKATDSRVVEGYEEMSNYYAIRKYVYQRVGFTMDKNASAPKVSQLSIRSTPYANWIIYRLTDVMLMKAEAEVELSQVMNSDSCLSAAFQLVSTVYNRANNLSEASSDTIKYSEHTGLANMRQLVLSERRRELLFEGKRWYDLVRFSLRVNDNASLIEKVIKKQKENSNAIKIKLNTQDALFWPYSESELDANPKLSQNPAYIMDETSSKN